MPSGTYDYDQLGQSTNENTNTNIQYYDPLGNNTSHEKVQQSNIIVYSLTCNF